MAASLEIGRIWNIPIRVHVSWLIIFGLLTWSLSSGFFPEAYPQLSSNMHILLGAITSILFFASVLAHELGHSVIALRNDIEVKNITLFIFGGVAQIAHEPKSPGAEFRIAIAGPIVSLALAGFFDILWVFDRSIPFLAAPSEYLARINLILAVFNLIPGFPLDGGRVLRSIVWKFTDSFQKANQVAGLSGQLVAFGFIGFGILTVLNGAFFNGIWLIFIGWFLQNAAASVYAQTQFQKATANILVSQVMSTDCTRIPTLEPISKLVEERVLTGGQRCFFVADNGNLEGMLTLKDITNIPKEKWRFTTVKQAMVPLDRLLSVSPHTELFTAIQRMDEANINQLPVIENGILVGVLTRDLILHYLRTRAELGI